MFEPDGKNSDKLLEAVSSVFHDAWVVWSKELAEKEKLSPERLERWQNLWVPYDQLDDKDKESDRKWARRVISIVVIVAQQKFDKWARNLEKRLKKRRIIDEV